MCVYIYIYIYIYDISRLRVNLLIDIWKLVRCRTNSAVFLPSLHWSSKNENDMATHYLLQLHHMTVYNTEHISLSIETQRVLFA